MPSADNVPVYCVLLYVTMTPAGIFDTSGATLPAQAIVYDTLPVIIDRAVASLMS